MTPTGLGAPTEPAPVRELAALAAALESLALPLELPGAAAAEEARTAVVAQLHDYVLPRYRQIDAPLLAVVGGSTGAGKSTLVNALVGAEVSRSSAIRPTTRDPVLVHHPDDAPWFTDQRVLPGMARVHGAPARSRTPESGTPTADGGAPVLALVPSLAVGPGLALLDAPDVDSVVDANRARASQLLAAADLWVFVTTASRYADAVPWALLRSAARRDAEVAVVLDRVAAAVAAEVREDLRRLLDAEGLADAPLFTVLDTPLAETGVLPPDAVAEVADWLDALARDATARAAVVRRTLQGAVASLTDRVEEVAVAADAQVSGAEVLRARIGAAYADATRVVVAATEDGSLLRGEVLARWQEFVGTGELFRSLQGRVGALRDRLGAFVRGRPQPATQVSVAIEHGLATMLRTQADAAAEHATDALLASPGGRALLAGADPSRVGTELSRASTGFDARAAEQIRQWQDALLDLVRTQGQERRTRARVLAFGVNGVGVALMIVAFATTGGLVGAEIGIAGGTAVVGQKLLEAVFGDQAVRRLARLALEDLQTRCEALMATERSRFERLLDDARIDPEAGAELRSLARASSRAVAGHEADRPAGSGGGHP